MITVRRYQSEDRGTCQKIFFHAVREGAAEVYSDAQRAAWAQSDWVDPDAPDKLATQMTWIADADGAPVGFMSLRADSYLDMAFVLRAWHGRGVADALYAQLAQAARDAGMTCLFVDASPLARRFFAKHGWQVEYEEDHPARGQVFHRFRMSLKLREEAR